MEFERYQELPGHLADKVIAAAEAGDAAHASASSLR